jgi:hypothetical protein
MGFKEKNKDDFIFCHKFSPFQVKLYSSLCILISDGSCFVWGSVVHVGCCGTGVTTRSPAHELSHIATYIMHVRRSHEHTKKIRSAAAYTVNPHVVHDAFHPLSGGSICNGGANLTPCARIHNKWRASLQHLDAPAAPQNCDLDI